MNQPDFELFRLDVPTEDHLKILDGYHLLLEYHQLLDTIKIHIRPSNLDGGNGENSKFTSG